MADNSTNINYREPQKEFALSAEDFRFIVGFVKEKTGITLGANKRPMVYSRLFRRLRALRLTSFTQYCALLRSDKGEAEVAHLVNAITTNLTHFFREQHHFDHLHHSVIQPLIDKNPENKRIRIWSAGCSSGAEPYSIAMVMHALLPNKSGWDCKILATDIDSNMLDIGRSAIYPYEACERVPEAYRHYLDPATGENMAMAKELRNMTFFKRLNLIGAWPMQGPFDVIFCRNVMIYFDKDTQMTLFTRMASLLKPGGWLYIGHSETMHHTSGELSLCGKTTYQKVTALK